MKAMISTLTERGQVSLPAALRKAMGLRPGQKLRWRRVSAIEIALRVEADRPPGPMAVLGRGPTLRGAAPRRTKDWMRELREGEA